VSGYTQGMATELDTPPAAAPRTNGAVPPPRWAGDDAVPRGLAVASAVTLRVGIVVGGIVLLALFAQRMMVVVLPVIIALLLATLLAPAARWLEARRWPSRLASFAIVALAFLVFLGMWALIIPGFVSQVPDLIDSVQQGAGQVASVTEPLGISSREARGAVDGALEDLKGRNLASGVLSGALIVTQWAAAVVLILVLTFFFVKDGSQLWDWVVCLFADERREPLREVGERAWLALSSYVQGVFLVATIDAVLIGVALLLVGVPMALPLIVLTFLAAFFPIIGAVLAGAAAVLVALVSQGLPAALLVGAVILVVQQLEGNVFYPIVVGRRLRLHAVAILLALTTGAVLAGVAGAFLAIPVAAVTSAVLDYMRQRRAHQRRHAVVAP
jgi:predicted PurR-regulated permease PerM